MHRFCIKSPAAQLAEELRRRITEGEWRGRMPGIRTLMQDYAVTRKTVEAALTALRHDGTLRTGATKRAAIPNPTTAPERQAGTALVINLPIDRLGGARASVDALLEKLPPPVTVLVRESHGRNTPEIAEEIRRGGFGRAVVLFHPPEVAEHLAEAGLNVVMVGSTGQNTRASRAGVSFEHLVRGAFRQAFALGHSRVCHPIWRRNPELIPLIRGWVADEYARAGLRHSPDFDAPIITRREPAALHDTLRALLRHTPPTALISGTQLQWQATLAILAEARMRVPQDISHLAIFEGTDWEAMPLAQSHFILPVKRLAGTVTRLLEEHDAGKPPRSVLLPPRWSAGQTLAPPRP